MFSAPEWCLVVYSHQNVFLGNLKDPLRWSDFAEFAQAVVARARRSPFYLITCLIYTQNRLTENASSSFFNVLYQNSVL